MLSLPNRYFLKQTSLLTLLLQVLGFSLLGIYSFLSFSASATETRQAAAIPQTCSSEEANTKSSAHFSNSNVNEKNAATLIMLIKRSQYVLEVADTPQKLQLGLMCRHELPERHGMQFLFSPPQVVVFWMRNTLIPLDMLFIRQSKIAHIRTGAKPCQSKPNESCPLYSSIVPVDMVIELPSGTVQQDKITVGQRVQFKPLSH